MIYRFDGLQHKAATQYVTLHKYEGKGCQIPYHQMKRYFVNLSDNEVKVIPVIEI